MRLDVSAPRQVLETLAGVGRTEDLRFSPNRQRLALVAMARQRLFVFTIRVKAGKRIELSDVVEQSIRLLEEESAYYKYEVGVLDTIDNVARRRFTRTVYSDSLIRVTRIKDTARLRVRIPDTRPGEYRVSFDYLIDSLDENLAPRMRVWLVEADSSRKGESSSILRKSSRERVSRILQADSSARSLVLSLYGTREKFRRPDVTIYDLKVSYTPETAEAVDSLYIDQLGLKIFADEFFSVFSPDSLQLPLHGEASR